MNPWYVSGATVSVNTDVYHRKINTNKLVINNLVISDSDKKPVSDMEYG